MRLRNSAQCKLRGDSLEHARPIRQLCLAHVGNPQPMQTFIRNRRYRTVL